MQNTFITYGFFGFTNHQFVHLKWPPVTLILMVCYVAAPVLVFDRLVIASRGRAVVRARWFGFRDNSEHGLAVTEAEGVHGELLFFH
jgi:hypothetical protein